MQGWRLLLAASIIISLSGQTAFAKAVSKSVTPIEFAEAVPDQELDASRGAALSPEELGSAMLSAIAANNISNGSQTGSNAITDTAFGNANGVISLIQNTGNNVVIQAATVVNLHLSD